MASWLALNGVLLLVTYLLGSFPSGYLAGKLLQGIDIREHGSGSTGATNVLRTLGKGPAIVVLAIDILKGSLAVALVYLAYSLPTFTQTAPPSVIPVNWLPWLAVLSGLSALLGHSKSIWLNFTGGKSVATGLGVLLTLDWQVGLATLAVFGLVIALSRIVSMSSIAAAIAVAILMLITARPLPYQLFAMVGGAYVIWRHRTNIQRLIAGTEPKLGQKAVTSD
ncbi:acyl-phosphate glycerol 3-phosphate acyltransferase [Leptolyngbya sp. 'hensonii']|uniref:glycerol-3-phosphate 1-O-acyltransferase PlsY n=1 Tax=Leptolyngbya sp. 'hensonii' TaxID=1922337 RepID=UPI00094F8D55|nr:glycerol-3-phosphate 1-O-acyltransferase PlsY [Leptolyngbya sp. 'hensonii']OLP19224.1 acyl-phosphate glycerol 3-phosphate acyltransferase [Leptolyngbya sp. 'hensonii']